jgi:hypothetical protein
MQAERMGGKPKRARGGLNNSIEYNATGGKKNIPEEGMAF